VSDQRDPLRFRYPWEPMSRAEKLEAARALLEKIKPGRYRDWMARVLERLEKRGERARE